MSKKIKKKPQKDRISRMQEILDLLKEEYPDAAIQLKFNSPHELLIATMLSAQSTDKQVNKVTKKLFEKYTKPEDYLEVPLDELKQDIYSTGFYNEKAKNIRKAMKMIIEEFEGELPDNMKGLLKLPGVGRKTANVVLGHAFDIPGIVVDTHVIKLTNRLGFVDTKNADKIEKEIEKLIPEEDWVMFTHYMISHGRNICKARKPKCGECVISNLCPSAFSFK